MLVNQLKEFACFVGEDFGFDVWRVVERREFGNMELLPGTLVILDSSVVGIVNGDYNSLDGYRCYIFNHRGTMLNYSTSRFRLWKNVCSNLIWLPSGKEV